jgi:hypothetical protein
MRLSPVPASPLVQPLVIALATSYLPAPSPSSVNLSSFSSRQCRHHPLPGPVQAPTWLEPPRRPHLHRLCWIRRCHDLPGRIPIAGTAPSPSPSSPLLDPSLPRPSRPDPHCWNRPVALPFIAFVGSVAAVAFSAGSVVSPSILPWALTP